MNSVPKAGEMLGHPKGLFLLFTTELWERFSYYAMRAILVLYLVDKVYSEGGKGMGWTQGDALSMYGTFTGLVYLTPLIGGWLADQYLILIKYNLSWSSMSNIFFSLRIFSSKK